MIRSAWFLARKDVQYMLRARETLFWTFLMPIVFFYFIGSITGGRKESSTAPLVVVSNPTAGFLVPHLETRLQETGFRIVGPDAGPGVPRLRIPPAFTDSVLAGHPVTLTVTREASGLTAKYEDLRVKRAVFTVLGDLVAATDGDHPPTEEGLSILAQAPPIVKVDVSRAGRLTDHVPSGFEQAVPGTMVMFTLLVLLTSGSVLLVVERNDGLLRRLASSPLPRASVILGKWGGRILIGFIQVAFAMVVGTLFFHMDWGPHLGALLAVLALYGGLVAFLGLIVGSVARTQGQAVAVGVLASNVLAALGGCWWPIEITPRWMQHLAMALPTGWAMDALHKLVSFGAPPTSVLPHLAVLAVSMAVAAWGAGKVFRFQ